MTPLAELTGLQSLDLCWCRQLHAGRRCHIGEAFVINGCYAGRAPVSAFPHLILGPSQPLAGSPLTWGLQAIVASSNRFDVKQGNRLIAPLSYSF